MFHLFYEGVWRLQTTHAYEYDAAARVQAEGSARAIAVQEALTGAAGRPTQIVLEPGPVIFAAREAPTTTDAGARPPLAGASVTVNGRAVPVSVQRADFLNGPLFHVRAVTFAPDRRLEGVGYVVSENYGPWVPHHGPDAADGDALQPWRRGSFAVGASELFRLRYDPTRQWPGARSSGLDNWVTTPLLEGPWALEARAHAAADLRAWRARRETAAPRALAVYAASQAVLGSLAAPPGFTPYALRQMLRDALPSALGRGFALMTASPGLVAGRALARAGELLGLADMPAAEFARRFQGTVDWDVPLRAEALAHPLVLCCMYAALVGGMARYRASRVVVALSVQGAAAALCTLHWTEGRWRVTHASAAEVAALWPSLPASQARALAALTRRPESVPALRAAVQAAADADATLALNEVANRAARGLRVAASVALGAVVFAAAIGAAMPAPPAPHPYALARLIADPSGSTTVDGRAVSNLDAVQQALRALGGGLRLELVDGRVVFSQTGVTTFALALALAAERQNTSVLAETMYQLVAGLYSEFTEALIARDGARLALLSVGGGGPITVQAYMRRVAARVGDRFRALLPGGGTIALPRGGAAVFYDAADLTALSVVPLNAALHWSITETLDALAVPGFALLAGLPVARALMRFRPPRAQPDIGSLARARRYLHDNPGPVAAAAASSAVFVYAMASVYQANNHRLMFNAQLSSERAKTDVEFQARLALERAAAAVEGGFSGTLAVARRALADLSPSGVAALALAVLASAPGRMAATVFRDGPGFAALAGVAGYLAGGGELPRGGGTPASAPEQMRFAGPPASAPEQMRFAGPPASAPEQMRVAGPPVQTDLASDEPEVNWLVKGVADAAALARFPADEFAGRLRAMYLSVPVFVRRHWAEGVAAAFLYTALGVAAGAAAAMPVAAIGLPTLGVLALIAALDNPQEARLAAQGTGALGDGVEAVLYRCAPAGGGASCVDIGFRASYEQAELLATQYDVVDAGEGAYVLRLSGPAVAAPVEYRGARGADYGETPWKLDRSALRALNTLLVARAEAVRGEAGAAEEVLGHATALLRGALARREPAPPKPEELYDPATWGAAEGLIALSLV